jgi:hypothetical protein
MTQFTLNSGDASATPTAVIVAKSNKSATVVDSLGRVITVKKLSALDRMRLFAIAGPELAQNESWIGMAALAFAVTGIGDDTNVRPNSMRELGRERINSTTRNHRMNNQTSYKITPKMIEAGVEAYTPYWADISNCLDNTPEAMVRDVYKAMKTAESKSHLNVR